MGEMGTDHDYQDRGLSPGVSDRGLPPLCPLQGVVVQPSPVAVARKPGALTRAGGEARTV